MPRGLERLAEGILSSVRSGNVTEKGSKGSGWYGSIFLKRFHSHG